MGGLITVYTQPPEMGSLENLFIPGILINICSKIRNLYSILLEAFQGLIMTARVHLCAICLTNTQSKITFTGEM